MSVAIDINGIRDFLPHRYPFLLVDRVVTLVEGQGRPSVKKSALRRGGPAKGGAPTGSGGWDRSVVLWVSSPVGK